MYIHFYHENKRFDNSRTSLETIANPDNYGGGTLQQRRLNRRLLIFSPAQPPDRSIMSNRIRLTLHKWNAREATSVSPHDRDLHGASKESRV